MNDGTQEEDLSFQEVVEEIRLRLDEHRAFLQTYWAENDPDSRIAEKEHVEDLLRLAAVMEGLLEELTEEEGNEDYTDMEVKSHILGLSDGSANIEADWRIDEPDKEEKDGDEYAPMEEKCIFRDFPFLSDDSFFEEECFCDTDEILSEEELKKEKKKKKKDKKDKKKKGKKKSKKDKK